MVALTPETLGNSLVVMGITYVVVLVFYGWSFYLNLKQAQVKKDSKEMVELLRKIEQNTSKEVKQ